MKKLLLILSILFSVAGFQACNNDKDTGTDDDTITVSDVPQPVQAAFSAKYAGATDIKWESATENGAKTYKAKFTHNGKKMKAEFGSDGNFIKED
jgi:hypothetical protein